MFTNVIMGGQQFCTRTYATCHIVKEIKLPKLSLFTPSINSGIMINKSLGD